MLGLVPQRAQPSSLVGCIGILIHSSLARLPVINRRKVGTTSNHHAPYALGYTRVTMARTTSRQLARVSKSLKPSLSSDCTLQLECMKSESLVNADQHAALNTFPGLVHTARHTMEVDHARSTWANLYGSSVLRQGWWLGWSRNKVAVPEGVAGSPPF